MSNQFKYKSLYSIGFASFLFMLSGIITCGAESVDNDTNQKISPGFDCSKASGVIEKTICKSETLSRLDFNLTKSYKTAKNNNPDIITDQRNWLKQRNSCKTKLLEECLEKSYQARIDELSNVKRARIILPDGWSEFTHSQWLTALKADKNCRANEDSKHIRYVSLTNLNADYELLTLVCDPGAYQDIHLVFLVSLRPQQPSATPISLNELYFKGHWKYALVNKVAGYIKVNKEKNQMTVTRRYTGTWTCGYDAHYDLHDVLNEKPLFPVSAQGDNDCYNGIYADEWPDVILPDVISPDVISAGHK